MKQKVEHYDVVVCGGGLAGFCAAAAAARSGARTALLHNRPVLGGNSSSEVGVTPHGSAAFHAYARETGIISEALIEERRRNHAEISENGWTNSVWDMVLYDMAMSTEGLTLHLNTDMSGVRLLGTPSPAEHSGPNLTLGYYHRPALFDAPITVDAVIAEQQGAELRLVVHGKTFIDCTGDGVLAHLAGCEWRMGSESREEFDEPHAPEEASTDTMGNSIHFRTRNTGRPCSYRAPEWAVHFEDASYFYDQGRAPKDERGGFWWLEIGVPHHTIHDNETIRHELTRHALGVWDWMKNKDPIMKERTRDYALEWIGQVPGKRESRRIMGHYLVTEHDIQNCTVFEDEIAFGGWFVDLHTPGGLLADSSEPTSKEGYSGDTEYAVKSYCGPYGIPLRSCIAKDATNLMMAGRNVSATHAALGTIRVMGTTALLGQACGTAAAQALHRGLPLAEIASGDAVRDVKQALLRDGCFLLETANEDPADLARRACATATSVHTLRGAGPDDRGVHDGLAFWRDQPQYVTESIETRRGQNIACGRSLPRTISLCLTNRSGAPQPLAVRLQGLDHAWDYRVETPHPIARGELLVPVGERQWVEWSLPVDAVHSGPADYVRLDAEANPKVTWHLAGTIVPGHTGTYQIGRNKMRRFGHGMTFSFRLDPPSPCFGPEQALTGCTRPLVQTNVWRSDPESALPQSLTLDWDDAVTVGRVELTFPGHLLREYHAYGPYYTDPQCPADYELQSEHEGTWRSLCTVTGNYQRHRITPSKNSISDTSKVPPPRSYTRNVFSASRS